MIGEWSIIGKGTASAPIRIEIHQERVKRVYASGDGQNYKIKSLALTRQSFLQIVTDPPAVILLSLNDGKLCKIASLGSQVEACYKKAPK
jgi:hypothetical protein